MHISKVLPVVGTLVVFLSVSGILATTAIADESPITADANWGIIVGGARAWPALSAVNHDIRLIQSGGVHGLNILSSEMEVDPSGPAMASHTKATFGAVAPAAEVQLAMDYLLTCHVGLSLTGRYDCANFLEKTRPQQRW